MQRISTLTLGVAVFLSAAVKETSADWVELANNDLVQGEVVSLDGEKVILKSENFGEMTIPRDKVRLIGLGERPLPTAPQAIAREPKQLNSQLPSLENTQFNELLEQALGGGGIAKIQQKLNKTKNDLKELQRDMGATPEADALDSYIQIFELFGKLAPRGNPAPPKIAPKPSQPKAEKQPQAEK